MRKRRWSRETAVRLNRLYGRCICRWCKRELPGMSRPGAPLYGPDCEECQRQRAAMSQRLEADHA